MLAYLNRGLILENAIRDLIEDYFNKIKFDKTYPNFNIRVTLQHPFARVGDKSAKAADYFPAVVVSTYDDEKPGELRMPPQTYCVGLTKEDIDIIAKTTETVADKKDNKKTVEKKIPGLCVVIAPDVLQGLYKHLEKNELVYGFSIKTYRTDKICVEIWSENIQLKNEIYEQLRLFILGNLRHLLTAEKYRLYDMKIDDDTVSGQRSGAYNDQFGVILSGASILFNVNYAIEEIVLDTQISDLKEDLIMEVINHVKGHEHDTRELIWDESGGTAADEPDGEKTSAEP